MLSAALDNVQYLNTDVIAQHASRDKDINKTSALPSSSVHRGAKLETPDNMASTSGAILIISWDVLLVAKHCCCLLWRACASVCVRGARCIFRSLTSSSGHDGKRRPEVISDSIKFDHKPASRRTNMCILWSLLGFFLFAPKCLFVQIILIRHEELQKRETCTSLLPILLCIMRADAPGAAPQLLTQYRDFELISLDVISPRKGYASMQSLDIGNCRRQK